MQEPSAGARLAERFELRQVVTQAPAYVEYRALDTEVGVEVAVQWIRPSLIAGAARQEQVLGAAVELRRFAHPSARKLHGAGPAAGTVWVSWQLASGRGPVPARGAPVELPSVVRWIDATCAALAALHAIGIVHGRLVAEDVVVVGGELRVGGAGVLRAIDPTNALEAWRRQLGLVAPELRKGGAPTASTDAWSVAAIAAAMIGGSDGADDAMRVVAKRHPPLHDLLQRVLAMAPEARPLDLRGFAKEARERASMPYLADDRTGPMRAIRVLSAAAPPPAAKPLRQKAATQKLGGAGRIPPPAAHDDPTMIDPAQQQAAPPQPETFALPTPNVAPPAPQPQPPAVAIAPVPAPMPKIESAPIPVAIPAQPSERVPRTRTPPPGGYQVVSMKPKDPVRPPAAAAEPAGKPASGRVKKPRLRSISDAGKRKFSVEPGAMGYLAPPRDVAEAQRRAARKRRLQVVIVAILLAGAAIGGYLIATRV